MRSRIFVFPALQESEEVLCPTFLKETHERALDGLHLSAGHFGDLAVAIDVRACDLLELEITCNIRVHKDLGEFPGCHDELGNEVDGIVAVSPKLSRWRLIWAEFAEKLTRKRSDLIVDKIKREMVYLGEVQAGRITAIIIVAVNVQHLLPLDG